ncbi:sigma-70 family RNA polymerase sigma factor [Pseudonocardia sp.]|uniref:RNA polymerase sigma factor n=1 Tax=Pseudonocardia sp. TaxID=60912 RepID=UPI0026331127|nr:sigma-70 family RNA polymerase sigma factor [Pseudonocardia sp.]
MSSPERDVDPVELLRRAQAGDQAAWNALVRRYTPLLRARIGGWRLQEADAFDVVQTTWLRLAENIHRIHTPVHLGGWLATVVSRESQRVARGRGRAVLAEDTVALTPDPAPGPEQRAVDGDVHRVLRGAVAELTPRRRELLAALFADDRRPYAEIARRLGVPIGTIGPTRARALGDLRRALELSGVAA